MTIITRSALEHWGAGPAPEVAHVVSDHRGRRVVTWAEVMEARHERQKEQLRRKREWFVNYWRAYRLWVAYFGQGLFGGWHAFLDDFRGTSHGIWIDRDRTWLIPMLLKAFPIVLSLGPEREQWEQWKISFAKQFERRRQFRKPLGVAYVWWNQRDEPRFVREKG